MQLKLLAKFNASFILKPTKGNLKLHLSWTELSRKITITALTAGVTMFSRLMPPSWFEPTETIGTIHYLCPGGLAKKTGVHENIRNEDGGTHTKNRHRRGAIYFF